ncbi:MAG: hypothetical protein AABY22_29910, partial [Nanoarchaeota archaeon]
GRLKCARNCWEAKKMEISNLKDLKEALSKIPDEVLSEFGAGLTTFDGVTSNELVQIMAWGEEDANQTWIDSIEKYPQIEDISRYIEAICQEQAKYEKDNEDESIFKRDSPISSAEIEKEIKK